MSDYKELIERLRLLSESRKLLTGICGQEIGAESYQIRATGWDLSAIDEAADALERLTAEREEGKRLLREQMALTNERTKALMKAESEHDELLAAIRNAKRTATLMHASGGHEVVCLEPQLWGAIARVKGK